METILKSTIGCRYFDQVLKSRNVCWKKFLNVTTRKSLKSQVFYDSLSQACIALLKCCTISV
jgi:hypothetical protein